MENTVYIHINDLFIPLLRICKNKEKIGFFSDKKIKYKRNFEEAYNNYLKNIKK